MRSIILFVIGLVFGTGFGYIFGTPTQGHDHASHSDTEHDHSTLTEWTGPAPSLTLIVTDDAGDAKSLLIDVAGFAFTPETVNTAPVAGTGHAHIYVNGVKTLRAYGPWVHLTNAPSGSVLRVTLTANDHTGWAAFGQPIMAEITVP